MLFNSVIFLTLFLPLALAGWYLFRRLGRPGLSKLFIIGMSFWFYGFYNVSYLWILLSSLLWNYAVSFLLQKWPRGGRWLLSAGILGNLGLLFYFKYFNFFVDNCNYFFHADISVEKIALPLGISFFTIQQISYLIERYRHSAPHYCVLDYFFYVSFFPQLIAGPIVLHSELMPQLQDPGRSRFCVSRFYDGLSLFILGLGKKVLLADSLAVLVNAEYGNIAALDMLSAWVVICWYMAELYFDFSGYSDMARGIAGMFGLDLPENFNSPFHADSVKEFWRRWHMTLTRFLTQYLYIPLGGSKKGKAKQCRNLLLVFLVSGIWHGANWTFFLWGLLNGLAVVFETLFPKVRFPKQWMNRLATSLFIILSFSVFRSDSLGEAALLWKKLFAGGYNGMFFGICNMLRFPENYVILKFLEMAAPGLLNPFYAVCMILLSVISVRLLQGEKAGQWIARQGSTPRGILLLATLFTWSFLSLSQVSVFLYFHF